MEAVTLREYRPGDWEAMYALDVRCFETPFRFSRKAMRSFAEDPRAVTLLAYSADQLVGFCVVQIEEHLAYVVTLDVAQTWRRRGLARRLMAEVEARIHTLEATELALHVYTGNMGAIHFYESIGFNRVGTAEAFYGRELDALIYAKGLND